MSNYIKVSLLGTIFIDLFLYSFYAIFLDDWLFLFRESFWNVVLKIIFCLLANAFVFSALCGVSISLNNNKNQ